MSDRMLTTYEEINQIVKENTRYSLYDSYYLSDFIENECSSKIIFIGAVYDSYKSYSELYYIHKYSNGEYIDISLDDILVTHDDTNLTVKNLSNDEIVINKLKMTDYYNEETGLYDLYLWYDYDEWNDIYIEPNEEWDIISYAANRYIISEPFINVVHIPTIDEAVDEYRNLCTDIADAIKETIGIRPDTTKLETWLYNTPRQYSMSKYRGYTYRDDTKIDIINECIKSLDAYDYEAYACSIDIEYYETGSYSSSSTVCYLDIYKYAKQTSSSSYIKTYLCRYKLTFNSTESEYPKYIGIEEKITSNMQDITVYGVSYQDNIYDKRYPNNSLLIPKNTIKPIEFAKTILGSGNNSNPYNYRWIFRDVANAIRSITGSTDTISAPDLPLAIRNLADRDLITESQKNLGNWTATGDGEVTITFNSSDKSNVVEFENTGVLTAESLINTINSDLGCNLPISASIPSINSRINDWNNKGYGLLAAFDGVNIYVFALSSNRLDVSGSAGNYTLNFNETSNYYYSTRDNTWHAGSSYEYRLLGIATYKNYGRYTDYPKGINNTYSLTIPTTGANIITFDAKSPTGFNASADQISVSYEVGGVEKTDTITLNNASSNTYQTYSVITDEVDQEVTITLDLSTIVSSNPIELNIKDISMHKVTST